MNIEGVITVLNNIEDVNLKACVKDVNNDYPIEGSFTTGVDDETENTGDIFLTYKTAEENKCGISIEKLKKQINHWKKLHGENATIGLKLLRADANPFEYYDITDIKTDPTFNGREEKCLVFYITKRLKMLI